MTITAEAFIETLIARGVTLRVRGTRLVWSPKTSYGALNDAERATLRQHKAAIVACVRECYEGVAGPPVMAVPTDASGSAMPTSAPAPEPCRWCHSAPCIGVEHEAFLDLHPVEASKHAAERATNDMLNRVGKPSRWDY